MFYKTCDKHRKNKKMNIRFSANQNDPLYNTKYLQLKKAKSPNRKSDWVYAHRPNAKDVVVIAPVIHSKDGDSVVFIETERPPIKAEGKADRCIELPAGLVGDENSAEETEQALVKELLEETGYKPDKITIQGKNIASSPGCTSETSTIAIADINQDIIAQSPITDGGVIKAIYKVPLKELSKWLGEQQSKGKAVSAQALSGLYFVLSRLHPDSN